MNEISQQEALALVEEAGRMSSGEILKLREQRLDSLVRFARDHSPLYRELYRELGDSPRLEDLPVVRKTQLTSRMSEWITDPEFSEEELERYLEDLENLEEPFMGRYSVSTTSGTTGVPLRMIRDRYHILINGAMMQARFYGGELLREIPELGRKVSRYASLIATGGYHAAYTGFERRKKMLAREGIRDVMLAISVTEPLEEMVEQLNDFQPDIVTGYPSVLDMLSFEQLEGRLKISPRAVLCSAEQLTGPAARRITERFGCPVGNVFCSTEGGEIAFNCSRGNMHINGDWIILEPVDRDGNPAAPGTVSEGVLVTNLMNRVQPIIRYYVDDCVLVHPEPCGCGSPFPHMDVLGRTDDIPEFAGDTGTVRLSPIAFFNAVVDIPHIATYQLVQDSPVELTLRVRYAEGADPEELNRRITEAIRGVLRKNRLENVRFTVLESDPIRAARGHKMRTYLRSF